jgi:zinc transporter, ZIP family
LPPPRQATRLGWKRCGIVSPVNAGVAFAWGAFASASLFIGQVLAVPLRDKHRATGQIMGFGAGTMLSAVAYELVPESSFSHGLAIGICLAIGALTYFIADRVVANSGGAERQSIDRPESSGSGAAMFIGALLDGVPEAQVLGVGLALPEAYEHGGKTVGLFTVLGFILAAALTIASA